MKIIKKADIILFIILTVFGLAISILFLPGMGDKSGDTVRISVDGKHYASYPLSEDREIEIKNGKHSNTIKIENGSVRMLQSNCKNQICVKSGSVSRLRSSIVCLPNRVVVEIENRKGGDVDVISN